MPPKVTRPAAAPRVKAAAKAKGVPAPRRGALRRGVRRRPSAEEVEVVAEKTWEEKWIEGESIDALKVPLHVLAKHVQVVAEGTYWGGEC